MSKKGKGDQESKKGKPRSAGKHGAKTSWYYSARYHVNMAKRAFRMFKRSHAFALRREERGAAPHACETCHKAGLASAKAHGDLVEIHYEKLVRAFHLRGAA